MLLIHRLQPARAQMTYRHLTKQLALWLLLACWQPYAHSALDIDEPQPLSLSKQPLSSSLIQLGKSRGISIIFPSNLVYRTQAPALNGHFSTRQALEQLLTNTHLTFREISPLVVAIIPKPLVKTQDYGASTQTVEELTVIGRSVTGSRLSRTDLEGSSPVDIISSPELARSGSQSLGEFLKFVPAVSGNSTSTSVSNGGDGTATVTLRGLPANNTLVLINGQRTVFAGMAGDSVDLNTIASSAVDRIEILKDGASAIYGSDAIAGVVNIVMKDEFEGFQVEQYYGESTEGDSETIATNLLAGHSGQRGGIMLSATYLSENGLFSRERDISKNADGRPQGGIDQRTSATPDGRITLSDRSVVIPTPDGSFRPATDEDLFNYREQTSSISPSDRYSVYLSGHYELNDHLKATAELAYSHTEATITLASAPLYTAFEDIPLVIAANNQYNPFGESLDDVRRRITELPAREQIDESSNRRMNIGLEGQHRQLHWDAHLYWSRSEAERTNTQLLNAEHVQRALGDANGCQGIAIDGCEPLNLFGVAGSITQQQLSYLTTTAQEDGHSELKGANINVDTTLLELNNQPVQFAAGLDLRHEESSQSPHNPFNITYIGSTSTGETQGERDIREAFFELQVPIANDKLGVYSLDLELAVRHSYYSDFGHNTSPKLGLRYRPIRDLLLRTTYSEGFRAPSLDELHKGGYKTQAFLDDPCAQIDNVGTLPGCDLQSDPTRIQYLTEFSGDTRLKPEESTSRTFGLVWTPRSIAGLSISIDHFWIEQQNVIDASPQTILDENAEFGTFADLVQRDSMGNLIKLYAPFINIGEREIKGVDIALGFQWLTGNYGDIATSLNASHLYEFVDQVSNNSPAEDLAGTYSDAATEGSGSLPQWKANVGIVWSLGALEIGYSLNYISSLTEDIPASNQSRTIDSWTTHDIQASYFLPVQAGLQLSLGVDNLLDQEPPFAAGAFNDNFDPRTYDLKGRFWYFRVNQSF